MRRFTFPGISDAIQFEDALWNRYSVSARRDGASVYVRSIDELDAEELAEEFTLEGWIDDRD